MLVTSITGADARRQRRWWINPQYTDALKLTDGEIQQLNQAYETYSLNVIELKGHVETERMKLQFMMEEEDLDEPAMEAQYNRLEKARATLSQKRFVFYIQVRKIIGPQRFSQLMEIFKARRSKRK